MTRRLQLSELVSLIQETIEDRFFSDNFWITAEITDVKKYEAKRWCFLKFIEKQGNHIATEMQGVFWANAYQHIILFERITRQAFTNGLEISCRVQVKFHPRYGLKLEVQEIDTSFALGKLEMERQQTLERLLRENPYHIQQIDDEFITTNKQLRLPAVIQRIALITAPNSDGQRDFLQELQHNPYGYQFRVTEFLTQIQGNQAAAMMVEKLDNIYHRSDIDAVVIVRGGGSQTDLKPFDDYELARKIAAFPTPVFTGIGHDRNTSIADLMARQLKTPTKVAAAIIDINFRFENELLLLREKMDDAVSSLVYDRKVQLSAWKEKMQRIMSKTLDVHRHSLHMFSDKLSRCTDHILSKQKKELFHLQNALDRGTARYLKTHREKLLQAERMIDQLSPQNVLNRGFAMVTQNNRVITSTSGLQNGTEIKTYLGKDSITSTITETRTDDQPDF